jgi:hypothetical protein
VSSLRDSLESFQPIAGSKGRERVNGELENHRVKVASATSGVRRRNREVDTMGAAVVAVETPAWQAAHERLVALAEQRAGLDADEGRWLLEALRSGAHIRLGYGGFNEYIERLFGYSPRFTQERLRVAEALEELPELHAALSSGALHWSVVRELTRVAEVTSPTISCACAARITWHCTEGSCRLRARSVRATCFGTPMAPSTVKLPSPKSRTSAARSSRLFATWATARAKRGSASSAPAPVWVVRPTLRLCSSKRSWR